MAVLPTTLREIAEAAHRPVSEIENLARQAGVRYRNVDSTLDPPTAWRLLQQARDLSAAKPGNPAESPATPQPPRPTAEIPASATSRNHPALDPVPAAPQSSAATRPASTLREELRTWREAYQRLRASSAGQVAGLQKELQEASEALKTVQQDLAATQYQARRLAKELSDEQRRRREAEEAASELLALGQENRSLEKQVREASRAHEALQKELQASRTEIESLSQPVEEQLRLARRALESKHKDEVAALRNEHAAEVTRLKKTHRQKLREKSEALSQRTTELQQVTEQLAELEAIRSGAATAAAVDSWIRALERRRAKRADVFGGHDIVLCGTGPQSQRVIQHALAPSRPNWTDPGDGDAGVMILGADEWLVDDIEDQIKARAGKTLRIYSQELALLAIEHGQDPLETATPKMLKTFAQDHPALTFCIEEGFMWPRIDTARVARQLRSPWDEQAGESPLHKMGYHVGKTSDISQRRRREILEQAFSRALPFTVSKDYMRQWGGEGSRRRLRRMATHIRWLIGGAYGRQQQLDVDMTVAIGHWQSDLKWLRDTLYEDWMRFRWPSTKV